jgi:hypothetical protein
MKTVALPIAQSSIMIRSGWYRGQQQEYLCRHLDGPTDISQTIYLWV